MSKIKRAYFPEIYQLIDGIQEVPMERDTLEAEAKQAICACYYYDLCDNIEQASDEELRAIIADSYHAHEVMDDRDECPEYQTEQAEKILDANREDGIA